MNLRTIAILIGLSIIIAGIASIATSSIGIQAYNKCDSPKLKEEHPKNFNYLVINLILAIFLTLVGFAVTFYARMVPPISLDTSSSLGDIKSQISNFS
jgi:formate hydrogenlyase subunit 3/multisubunit Na+/H+ antiporter MnhD subunit